MPRLSFASKVFASIALFGLLPLPACQSATAEQNVAEKTVDDVGINPVLPVIPDEKFNLTDFGAVGDGKTINTVAFHKAIDAISNKGGGHLIVPKGEFVTGPFTLCSHLDLHLEEGAVIQAPATFAENGMPDPANFKTQEEIDKTVQAPNPLITGEKINDLAITGSGTIDGKGQIWWDHSERAVRQKRATLYFPRPKLIVISHCKRFHVDGVTLQNSPKFHLGASNVSDMLIEHVKVFSPWQAPNTDAIDPGPCTNVVIRDCDIDTGDDDVAVKGSGKVENLLIENCRIKHGHGISVGSDTAGGISNMTVRNCSFDGTLYGLRIKSMRGAGGPIRHVRYSDITINNVSVPILFDLMYVDNNRPNFKGDPKKVPSIEDVVGENITITDSPLAGRFQGLEDSPMSDIHFKSMTVTADKPFEMKNVNDVSFENLKMKVRTPSTQPVVPFIE